MDDGLGVATKLELVFKSPLRQTFQDHLQVTESHKLDLWSLWILGHSLSDSETKKDSIGRSHDSKAQALLAMARNPALRLCESTKTLVLSLEQKDAKTDLWSCVEVLLQDIEQRLAHEVQWFLAAHWDELLPEAAPLVDVASGSPERVFRAFCNEMVGIRLTFLHEHYAAFSGGDAVKWFGSRTNLASDAEREKMRSSWIENGWIDGLGKRVLPTFNLWTVTKAGVAVWGCGYHCYEHNLGMRQVLPYETFMCTKQEATEVEMMDECVKSLLASQGKEVMLRVSGSQLCGLLMKQADIPLDTAVSIGGQLLACGYLMKAGDDDDESSDLSSSSGNASGSDEEKDESEKGNGDQAAVATFRPSVFTLYAVTELVKPNVLNGSRSYVGPPPDAARALQVSQEAYTLLQELWDSLQQSPVHSSATETLPAWKAIRQVLLELHAVNVDRLKGDAAAAFWVNVHNALFVHSWIIHRTKFDPPEDAKELARYRIGTEEYTMAEMHEQLLKTDASRVVGFLLSNNYRMCTTVATDSDLAGAVAKQASEDFRDVELCEGNIVRVSRVAQLVCGKWAQEESAEFLSLVMPYLSTTWADILTKMRENGLIMSVDFNEGQEIYMWGGSMDEQQSVVGGGKDLWAVGVMKNYNDARADLAVVKGESQMLQMTFDLAATEQQELKTAFAAQEEQSKELEAQVKRMKDEYAQVSDQVRSTKSSLSKTKAAVEKLMAGVTNSQKVMHAAFDDTCNGVRSPLLESMYEKAHQAYLALVDSPKKAQTEASVERRKAVKTLADEQDLLRSRDPLSVGSEEDAPWKWVESEHLKWLQEKCNHFVPNMPGDDAFLSTIRRVQAELKEDPSLLESFFSKQMVECYARFFSTWKERVATLMNEVLVNSSDTPAIVAANGWFHAENILVGVLRYRQYFPGAREAVERLHESIGFDAGTLEYAASAPDLVGLSKPGRFLLMRGRVCCRLGSAEELLELELILFSDLLLVMHNGVSTFHKLEQCVVIEPVGDSDTLELFNSGLGTRLLMRIEGADKRELWARRLSFACTMTKLKFRHSADHLKRQSQTLRGTMRTAFDDEIEREQKEQKKRASKRWTKEEVDAAMKKEAK